MDFPFSNRGYCSPYITGVYSFAGRRSCRGPDIHHSRPTRPPVLHTLGNTQLYLLISYLRADKGAIQVVFVECFKPYGLGRLPPST